MLLIFTAVGVLAATTVVYWMFSDWFNDQLINFINHDNDSTTFMTWQQSGPPSKHSVLYPQNIEELIEHCKSNPKFRALGAGHNFSGSQTSEVLISTKHLNKLIHVDPNTHVVKVQAGMIIKKLIVELEKHNLALHNMGNFDTQTIGGAIICGTHGTSGAKSQMDTFTSTIISMEMVTAEGKVVTLGKTDSVTMGIGGIVVELTLQARPFYFLNEETNILTLPEINLASLWTDAHLGMIRWTNPHSNPAVIQEFKFTEVDRNEYKKYSVKRILARVSNIVIQGVIARSYWLSYIGSKPNLLKFLQADSNVVDKYYYVYIDVPALRRVQTEHAIAFSDDDIEKLNDIVREIPETMNKCFRNKKAITQLLIRFSPKDAAVGHIAHHSQVCWFHLNIISYAGYERSYLNDMLAPWEALMAKYNAISAYNKYTSNQDLNLNPKTKQYLSDFREKHDPQRKMHNSIIEAILNKTR